MKIRNTLVMLHIFLMIVLLPAYLPAQEISKEKSKLAVLWTSGDPDVANRVAFMYTHTAKKAGWFDEVTLIIWGPSQKLLLEKKELQAKVKAMQDDGIIVEACIACAVSYNIVDDIKALGITVKGMGIPLTEYLKSDWKVLTF